MLKPGLEPIKHGLREVKHSHSTTTGKKQEASITFILGGLLGG